MDDSKHKKVKRGRKKKSDEYREAYDKLSSISIRFPPLERFFLDMAARSERRSITSFVLECVDCYISKMTWPRTSGQEAASIPFKDFVRENLFDTSHSERLINIFKNAPHLLNYDEMAFLKKHKEESE